MLTFADRRAAAVFETGCRDELIQAIYRLRPHDVGRPGDDRASATVVLMTEFPVEGLRVDGLRFSGNAAAYETSVRRLEEASARLQAERGNVTSRELAEAAGLHVERAQEHLRQVSAARSHPLLRLLGTGGIRLPKLGRPSRDVRDAHVRRARPTTVMHATVGGSGATRPAGGGVATTPLVVVLVLCAALSAVAATYPCARR